MMKEYVMKEQGKMEGGNTEGNCVLRMRKAEKQSKRKTKESYI